MRCSYVAADECLLQPMRRSSAVTSDIAGFIASLVRSILLYIALLKHTLRVACVSQASSVISLGHHYSIYMYIYITCYTYHY